jgi:hypothetical protein
MKMHHFAKLRLAAWILIVLLSLSGRDGHAAALGEGTYTGIYTGSDYGAVTIVVDAQSNVTCDFFSSPTFTHYQSSGTVNTGATWFLINCVSPSTASYYWSASSNPNSAPANALIGAWGGSLNGNQVSGSFTAYYTSVNTDPAGSLSTASFAGLWYEPQYTGTGFNILPSSVGLLVTYYGVDANGKPLWLISDIGPKSITIGSAITLNMSYSSSGNFQAPIRNPIAWGQLTLTFTSCTAASATLSGTDGTLTESLSLLAGAIGTPGCQ